MLIILLIQIVLSANENGKQEHTKTFIDHGVSNANGFYFIPQTYGGNLGDMCAEIKDRQAFLKILKNYNIQCGSNQWCLDGQFQCPEDKTTCYHMEHMVDNVNTEFPGCKTNILGNLAMTYGKWNKEVGQLNWSNVKREKGAIYGKLFDQAMENVRTCCYGSEDKPKYEIIIYIGVAIVGVLIIGFIILGAMYKASLIRYTNEIELQDYDNLESGSDSSSSIEEDIQ